MSLFKSTKHTEFCPECGSPLQMKKGKQGLFLGCSNYPACDYLKPLQQTSHIIKTLDERCPECASPLQLKQGHFGMFIGCSHYPECHFTVQENQDVEEAFICPECHHPLLVRTGRAGKTFYGCTGYPTCKFTLASKPVVVECPQCHGGLATIKKQRGKDYYLCANRSCQHLFNLAENEHIE
ncbi:hypothetical protein A4G19_02345 [Pasteurellaceae bacterium Macca]|nr:hypothetical protein [Pasteurellaceae bacterium Macca]